MAEIRAQYSIVNGRNYVFYDDGKGRVRVAYEDKSGKEATRIDNKAKAGGYAPYTAEQIKGLIGEDKETGKTYITLGVFLKGDDGKYGQFQGYPTAFEIENGNNAQALYFARESRKQGSDVYVENIFTNPITSESTNNPPPPQEPAPAPTTTAPAVTLAPEQLSQEQVEYWEEINEIPENLLTDDVKAQLAKIKTDYPDQITNKSLTKEELDKLSPTEKVALLERSYAVNKAFANAKKDPAAASITTGTSIIFADPCKDNFFAEVESKLEKFFKVITKAGNKVLNLRSEINTIVSQISTAAKQFIGKITSALAKQLTKLIKDGLSKLAKKIFDTVTDNPLAKVVKEQSKLVDPVNALFNALKCVAAKITEALQKTIEDLIVGMVKNVLNAPRCAVEDFIGALTNKITSLIDSVIGPLLGPVQKVLGFVFKVRDAVLSAIKTFRKIENFFKCNEKRKCPTTTKWKVDQGERKDGDEKDEKNSFDKMLDKADKALDFSPSQKLGEKISEFEQSYGNWGIFKGTEGIGDVLGDCNTGNVFACGTPKVEFFGGAGAGASGQVILGKFLKNVDKDDIFGGVQKTASIIGVDITSPGGGYTEAPLVAFSDGCEQGYGAYGKAIIDTNQNSPTYGQVTSIVIISEGENYPAEEYEPQDTFIDDVIIENPGSDYSDTDELENEDLKLVIKDGSIDSIQIINQNVYRRMPEINIKTTTGYGAVIKPVMRTRRRPQTEVVQVIDCVS